MKKLSYLEKVIRCLSKRKSIFKSRLIWVNNYVLRHDVDTWDQDFASVANLNLAL